MIPLVDYAALTERGIVWEGELSPGFSLNIPMSVVGAPNSYGDGQVEQISVRSPTNQTITLDDITEMRYVLRMIKSFRSPEAEKIFQREPVRKLPYDIQRTALRKLWMIDAAPDLISLRVPPGNRLEALSGNRAGQHSLRINDQWRICFRWRDGNAHEVEIVDYH